MVSGNSSLTPPNIDTTIFRIAPARIDFKMVLSPQGKVDVQFGRHLRKVELIKQWPKASRKSSSTSASQQMEAPLTEVASAFVVGDTVANSDSLFSDPILREYSVAPTEPVEIGLEGTDVKAPKSDWLVGVLLFSLLLLAIIKFSYGKLLSRVVDSVFNSQVAYNLFNEKNITNLRGAIFMNLLFFVNTAIFIVEYLNYYRLAPFAQSGLHLFFICFLGLLGLYLIKFVGIGIVGQVFKASRESREYMHTVFLFNKNLGLFLFPVIVSAPFIVPYAVPMLLKAGIGIAAFFYILRLLRGLKILFKKHVSIFYMILYLCALEILPLLMVYKLFVTLS